MVSLMSSASLDSLRSSTSQSWAGSQYETPPRSPALSVSATSRSTSSTSSRASLNAADDENLTINAGRASFQGKQKSQEDLRFLAISTHLTELSYTISDIQARLFEIQELRHQSQSAQDTSDASGTSSVIDKALSDLDERLDSVRTGIKAANELMNPLLAANAKTPTQASIDSATPDEEVALLRMHAALLTDWEGVQRDSEMLREELREDKWLTVFRTVTEQADGMMASLEKAVKRCQDFIRMFDSGRDSLPLPRSSSTSSLRSHSPVHTLEKFSSLSDTFEAKKKHYMPATSKVLAILDRGVQDRVTKNGECLRRHAGSTERWRKLQKQIVRTDSDMQAVRHILEHGETAPSEAGSSRSGNTAASTKDGYLATPPGGSGGTRHGHRASTIGRSMSPLRKLGRLLRGTPTPQTPDPPVAAMKPVRTPSSEPVQTLRRQRTSIFGLRSAQPATPVTPNRPAHKYSQSFTPDATPPPPPTLSHLNSSVTSTTSNGSGGTTRNVPKWNASTKVDEEARAATIKQTPPRRPSAMGFYASTSGSSGTPYQRSLSRSSMSSSRPWSPVTSSTTSSIPPIPNFRPPSRSAYVSAPPATPRSRPRTPSYIPAPKTVSPRTMRSLDGEGLPRAFSPFASPTRGVTPLQPETSDRPSSRTGHPPRPPSRSMIPVPSVQLQAASRPSSMMSQYRPESVLSNAAAPRLRTRPSMDAPPSSFRDGRRTPTRAPSRGGARTPGAGAGVPDHIYAPVSAKDPLDAAVAAVVNSVTHAFVVARNDPLPRGAAPPPGTELRGQYTFSSALSQKILNVKLTAQKRLMCRVGGGWEDLRSFLATHPTSM